MNYRNGNHHSSVALTTDIRSHVVPDSDLDASPKLNKSSNMALRSPIEVVQPNQAIDGKSQAEWGNFWWTKIHTTPKNKNPLTSNNNFEKTGSVQMLVGTGFGEPPVVRDIRIDDTTYLFAPIVNSSADNAGLPPDWTTADSRYFTQSVINAVDPQRYPENNLFYEVDGKSLIDRSSWTPYRQQSPSAFSFVVPKNHYIGPEGGYTAGLQVDDGISDGYWVMLNPLPSGKHTIHFGGTFDLSNIKVKDLDGDGQIGFDPTTTPNPTAKQVVEYYLQSYQGLGKITLDVTYNVQVTHASTTTPRNLDLSELAVT